MKTLYLIGGTMGVGKTAVCQELKKILPNAVFLDGDWCWDSSPFQVTEETKRMVLENITFLLNQFLRCSAYQNIIFCWVIHEQSILDTILEGLDTAACQVKTVSLVCEEAPLRERLQADIDRGLRQPDILKRSAARLPLYDKLNTVKVGTTGKTLPQICHELMLL